MYFTCASCGSTRYEKREGQIFCAYCGAMYLVEDEQKTQRQKKSIWGIAVIVLLIVFILAGVIRPERDKENIQNNNIPQQPKSQSYIQIDNTNAQIGTQVVMIGSQNIQNSATSKSYAVSDTRTPSSPPKPGHDSEGIIHTTVKYQMPKIKVAKDASVKIDNKNLNFTNQKIIKTKDRATGTITTTVLTGGFNDRQNRVYLDRKGVVSLLGSVTLSGHLISEVLFSRKGNILFYVSKHDNLYIVDISTFKKPKVLATIKSDNITDIILSPDERYLYLNCKEGFRVYDISNLTAPVKAGEMVSSEYYRGMVLSSDGSQLLGIKYGSKRDKSVLGVIDISTPSNISELFELSLDKPIGQMLMYRNRLYLTHRMTDDTFSIVQIPNREIKQIKTGIRGLHEMVLLGEFVLMQGISNEIVLCKDERVVHHFNYRSAWHNFYKRIEQMHFVPGGKYVVFIASNKSIGFKRIETFLPLNDKEKEKLYDKSDYLGNYYTAIISVDTDKIKKIYVSRDERRLFAFSSSEMYVYNISKLKDKGEKRP